MRKFFSAKLKFQGLVTDHGLVAEIWCFHRHDPASISGWEPKPAPSRCRPRPPEITGVKTLCFQGSGAGSIPGQGTKTPRAMWCGQKKEMLCQHIFGYLSQKLNSNCFKGAEKEIIGPSNWKVQGMLGLAGARDSNECVRNPFGFLWNWFYSQAGAPCNVKMPTGNPRLVCWESRSLFPTVLAGVLGKPLKACNTPVRVAWAGSLHSNHRDRSWREVVNSRQLGVGRQKPRRLPSHSFSVEQIPSVLADSVLNLRSSRSQSGVR